MCKVKDELYRLHTKLKFPRYTYHIHGLFGGDFNLAVWQIFIGSPNLNHAVLTRTHEMN